MNCKPGDLAIIVTVGAGPFTPGIVGRVVEVIRRSHHGEIFDGMDGNRMRNTFQSVSWVVRSSRPLPWLAQSGPNAGKTLMFHERTIGDMYLRPISGVPVTDDMIDEVKSPCAA